MEFNDKSIINQALTEAIEHRQEQIEAILTNDPSDPSFGVLEEEARLLESCRKRVNNKATSSATITIVRAVCDRCGYETDASIGLGKMYCIYCNIVWDLEPLRGIALLGRQVNEQLDE